LFQEQNLLSSQGDPAQMLCGEISHLNLQSAECHSSEWRFEWRSRNSQSSLPVQCVNVHGIGTRTLDQRVG